MSHNSYTPPPQPMLAAQSPMPAPQPAMPAGPPPAPNTGLHAYLMGHHHGMMHGLMMGHHDAQHGSKGVTPAPSNHPTGQGVK